MLACAVVGKLFARGDFVCVGLPHDVFCGDADKSIYQLPASVMIGGSAVYSGAAAIFWHESRRQETQADRLLSVVFFGWGLIGMGFAFFEREFEARHLALHPTSSFPAAFAAILMVMAL